MRLVDNQINKPNQGNVEIRYDVAGTDWIEACYYDNEHYEMSTLQNNEDYIRTWSWENAKVVCLQLGYPGVMSTEPGVYYRLDQINSTDTISCGGGKIYRHFQ